MGLDPKCPTTNCPRNCIVNLVNIPISVVRWHDAAQETLSIYNLAPPPVFVCLVMKSASRLHIFFAYRWRGMSSRPRMFQQQPLIHVRAKEPVPCRTFCSDHRIYMQNSQFLSVDLDTDTSSQKFARTAMQPSTTTIFGLPENLCSAPSFRSPIAGAPKPKKQSRWRRSRYRKKQLSLTVDSSPHPEKTQVYQCVNGT